MCLTANHTCVCAGSICHVLRPAAAAVSGPAAAPAVLPAAVLVLVFEGVARVVMVSLTVSVLRHQSGKVAASMPPRQETISALRYLSPSSVSSRQAWRGSGL